MLRCGQIEMGHGRAILGLPEQQQLMVANKVFNNGLSVRATEAIVKRLLKGDTAMKPRIDKDPDIARLQQSVSEKLGAKVDINHTDKGVGKIVIHYSSLDELEGVLGHLK
jgi:ParB family chromosome partitioning protein